MNCHWYYSQFKWCSGTNDSGNFCCPRSHGISLGVCLGKGQYGSVYHCKFEALHETSEQNAMTASGKTFVEGAAKVFSLAVDSEAHTNFMNELHMLRYFFLRDPHMFCFVSLIFCRFTICL